MPGPVGRVVAIVGVPAVRRRVPADGPARGVVTGLDRAVAAVPGPVRGVRAPVRFSAGLHPRGLPAGVGPLGPRPLVRPALRPPPLRCPRLGHRALRPDGPEARPEDLAHALVTGGVGLRGFAVQRPSLEDLFVGLTGEGFDVAR